MADDQLSLVFSALADPNRRDMLARLASTPLTVGELAAHYDITAPAVSRHLRVLERAGLLTRTATAQWRTLTLRPEPLEEATAWVEEQRRAWGFRLDALDAMLRESTAKNEGEAS